MIRRVRAAGSRSEVQPTLPVLFLVVVACLAVGCGYLSRPSFAVGDCVRADSGVFDDDLEAAGCDESLGDPLTDGILYRVARVLDGASSSCAAVDGTRVEFSHEPDGVTYCLIGRSDPLPVDQKAPVDDFTGDGAPPDCIDASIEGRELPEHCAEYGYDLG